MTFSLLSLSLFDPRLYAYCEHAAMLEPQQPFNIYSSALYLLAAWLIVRRRHDLPKGSAILIALLLVATAAGSALWHWHAQPQMLWADLGLASSLTALFTFLVLRFVFYAPFWSCLFAPPLLLIVMAFTPAPSEWIAQDAAPLLAPAVVLTIAGIWSTARHSNAGLFLLMAALWLASGFIVLSLDLPACSLFPHGLHFLWNILAVAGILCLARAIAAAETELLYYEPALEEGLRAGFESNPDDGSPMEDTAMLERSEHDPNVDNEADFPS